jgi:hypothetical protein
MSEPQTDGHKRGRSNTVQSTISVYPRDKIMVEELIEYFGNASASEIYRTAVRNLYTQTLGIRK